jgi:hypothetical protein
MIIQLVKRQVHVTTKLAAHQPTAARSLLVVCQVLRLHLFTAPIPAGHQAERALL